MKYLIVGAGFTGAVIARKIAEAGYPCVVLEKEKHVAGNCHTKRDPATGILLHCFGPHTLHSDNCEVWSFLERFAEIRPYAHKKQAWANGVRYPFPINLETINQFFKTRLAQEQAMAFVRERALSFRKENPANFEEAALSCLGEELYQAFFRGYTKKQWGRDPKELPAEIFDRIPLHFSNNRNVFHHKRQGQPVGGYTRLIENILSHPNIELRLNMGFSSSISLREFQHLFYTGPIDAYFEYKMGRLPYRTLDFREASQKGTFQACGTVSYCDESIPHTRIVEHKHFFPWEEHANHTVITYEYSRESGSTDKPYYPVHLSAGNALYREYVQAALRTPRVSFVGRLGTYRYLDMDKAIEEAMTAASMAIDCIVQGRTIPPFFQTVT